MDPNALPNLTPDYPDSFLFHWFFWRRLLFHAFAHYVCYAYDTAHCFVIPLPGVTCISPELVLGTTLFWFLVTSLFQCILWLVWCHRSTKGTRQLINTLNMKSHHNKLIQQIEEPKIHGIVLLMGFYKSVTYLIFLVCTHDQTGVRNKCFSPFMAP